MPELVDTVKRNFFVIDSDHLETVQTRFYGFSVDEHGVVNSNMHDNFQFTPNNQCGAWTYVERNNNEIIVHQDHQGSFGLYLFQVNGYFAISNSFIMLTDFVKAKYHLTLNNEYAEVMLQPYTMCSLFVEDTLAHEIRFVSRHEQVHIDVSTKTIQVKTNVSSDFSITLDSVEGLHVLDHWVEKWVNIIKTLTQQTENICINLTGGMDSRIVFMLFLLAGVSPSTCVSCMQSTNETFDEDFKIASTIVSKYGFTLNDCNFSQENMCSINIDSTIKNSFYSKLGMYKHMKFMHVFAQEPIYVFNGFGGEALKDLWQMLQQTEVEDDIKKYYPARVVSEYAVNCFYRETEERNCHGKEIVENFLANVLILSPLMDPMLRKLTLNSRLCKDKNLLYAIIYTRYTPALLDIPFDSGHAIQKQTVEFAQKLNGHILSVTNSFNASRS